MIGPSGYGSADYIGDNGKILPYTIDFENSPTATAPAQEVTITDQLGSNLNWSTFQLTAIGWGDFNLTIPAGSQYYQTTVPMTYNGRTFDVEVTAGIHTATGQVYATFLSLDPATGLPPDVLTGFLPPEDGTGRGKGYVSYTIDPKTGLATGTQITNVADISFDGQPFIATDQVNDEDPSQGTDPAKMALVTIDAVPPTSSIAPLPTVENNPNFTVQWSGADDSGSGVASYSIYVSTNGGTYTKWQDHTTATSATFTGQVGDTYAFYSIATDNVGNVEAAPTTPEAQTQVLQSLTLSPIANQTVNEGDTLTLQTSATVNPSRTLTYSLTGAPKGASIDPSTGLFAFTPTEGEGAATYDLTVQVSAGVGTASQSFNVTVLEDTNIDARQYVGNGMPDTFRLVETGSLDQVFLNNTLVFSQPLGNIPSLTFTGSSNTDSFIVDYTGGNPIPAGGIVFNGGVNDTLTLTGGTVSNDTDTFSNAASGSIDLDGSIISYANLTGPISDNLNAQTRSLLLGNQTNTVSLAIGQSQATLSGNTGDALTFTNPTASLSLSTGSGNDRITVSGSKPSFSLVVDPGSGTNKITDQTGYGVAHFTGTTGNDTILLMQMTTHAIMVDVNDSATTCMGVKGFEIEAMGGNDRITLEGTLPSVLVDGGSGTSTMNASGFRGSVTALDVATLTAPRSSTVTESALGTSAQTAMTQVKQGSTTTGLSGPALTQNDILGVTSAWLADFLKGPQNNPNTTIRVVV